MSECFICQRAEGVVELPLGPFCVQCIKEIGKSSESQHVKSLQSWPHRCAYIANQLRSYGFHSSLDEWDRRCLVIANSAAKRGLVPSDRKALDQRNEAIDKAFERIAEFLNRPRRMEDTNPWLKRCDRMAKKLNKRGSQR